MWTTYNYYLRKAEKHGLACRRVQCININTSLTAVIVLCTIRKVLSKPNLELLSNKRGYWRWKLVKHEFGRVYTCPFDLVWVFTRWLFHFVIREQKGCPVLERNYGKQYPVFVIFMVASPIGRWITFWT